MAYAMTKQGSLDNCVTYEFICDTVTDMNAIENRYRTIGTVAIVLQGSGGLEVYIAGSDKQWNSLGAMGGSSSSSTTIIENGLSIHICSQNEIRFGKPNISTPDDKTIYLVPAANSETGNLYEEYIYVNNQWEKFGSGGSNIDLSDYVTYQDLDSADYATYNDLNGYASLDNNGKVSMEQLPLPTITSNDNGKILKVKYGDWSVENEVDISGKVDKKYEVNFELKTWNGLTIFFGENIWTDGENIYCSYDSTQYILNKATSTWVTKTWNGLTDFGGDHVWTDGENIYFSFNQQQYVLDKSTSTWSAKTWNGFSVDQPKYIWTDGENIYYSLQAPRRQYVLDKSTSTWNEKTWNGLDDFQGDQIWTDGEDIYYSNNNTQYVLDKSTSTWSTKTWYGLTSFQGRCIWTDGEKIYCSAWLNQYVLDKSTSTWNVKTWSGMPSFYAGDLWTDGRDIYYSNNSNHYVLEKDKILLGNAGTFSLVSAKKFTKTFIQELLCLPEAPSTDGTYTLQVIVTDGIPTYSWV